MTTRRTLANRTVQQPGQHTSPALTITPGTVELWLELDLTAALRGNPTTVVKGVIEWSNDGTNFYSGPACTWEGGAINPDTGQSYVMTIGGHVPAGATHVRGILENVVQLSLGIILVTEP